MNERGWDWTDSEIRHARLIEWLAQSAGEGPVGSFYDDLPDQSLNTWDVQYSDLDSLQQSGLVSFSPRVGQIRASVTPAGRDFAARLTSTRADAGKRRIACRDAMVAWLSSCDATSAHPQDRQLRDAMLDDLQRGMWFAQPFSARDLETAAGWLFRKGLVAGPKVEEDEGPLQLYLTDDGIQCAEDFDSNAGRYVEARRQPSGSSPTVNIGTNSGPFQVAGNHAHQVQNIGASAEHLRELIVSLGTWIRQAVPDASGIDAEQQTALAAAGDGAVDQSALRRFAAWVISVFRTGATVALVPAVTAATNDMLQEAARVAGHLG